MSNIRRQKDDYVDKRTYQVATDEMGKFFNLTEVDNDGVRKWIRHFAEDKFNLNNICISNVHKGKKGTFSVYAFCVNNGRELLEDSCNFKVFFESQKLELSKWTKVILSVSQIQHCNMNCFQAFY